MKNPSLAKKIKGSPSEKSSNSGTHESNKAISQLDGQSNFKNAPTILAINQQTILTQPQMAPIKSSSSLPKHEKIINSQLNYKPNMQYTQNQAHFNANHKKYDPFSPKQVILPTRQIPQSTL